MPSNDPLVIIDKTFIGTECTVSLVTASTTNVSDGNCNVDDNDEVIDDWGLSNDHNFHLFAQHEIRVVYMLMRMRRKKTDNSMEKRLSNSCDTIETTDSTDDTLILKKFHISCVEALTPIDMIDLGYGIHDATCHCVWTGAFLFIAAICSNYELLYPYIFHRNNDDTPATLDTEHRPIHVLELGCGTGIGSIGIWTAFHDDNNKNSSSMALEQLHLTMTDADPEALKLCCTNCALNHIPTGDYDIESLFWGEEIMPTTRVALCSPYDVVFATDVLYDISLLLPLLQTAYNCLCHDGYFILAHVPRACYKSTHPAVSNLNDYIIHSAVTDGGFQFERIIHPNECCHCNDSTTKHIPFPKDALNSMSLQEMQDIGASIFIFQKSSKP
jgi:2-polyprenyl-3-methyl-5-hydroxy-6-metoxy-1,4-benzoquinol methylase